MCRPAEENVVLAGFSTPLSLVNSLQEWCDNIHEYTLSTLVNAAVHLNGGIAANFAEPRLVLLRLRPVNNPDNPAKAFQVVQTPEVVGPAYNPEFFLDWEKKQDACRIQAYYLRRGPLNPTYAGSLLVLVAVENTLLATYRPFPIYALKSLDIGPLNDRARGAFEDILDLCLGFLRAGIVAREPPRGSRRHEPDTGILVKGKKKWVWKRGVAHVIGRAPNGTSVNGLTTREAWKLFHEL